MVYVLSAMNVPEFIPFFRWESTEINFEISQYLILIWNTQYINI